MKSWLWRAWEPSKRKKVTLSSKPAQSSGAGTQLPAAQPSGVSGQLASSFSGADAGAWLLDSVGPQSRRAGLRCTPLPVKAQGRGQIPSWETG